MYIVITSIVCTNCPNSFIPINKAGECQQSNAAELELGNRAELVVVGEGKEERAERPDYHEHQFQTREGSAAIAAVLWSRMQQLRHDVHSSYVEEGPCTEQHGQPGGIDVRQSLLAVLAQSKVGQHSQ